MDKKNIKTQMVIKFHLAVLAFTASTTSAHATLVEYDLSNLGGSSFRYEYTLANNGTLGAGVVLQSFDIDFADALITSFSGIGSPDWDPSFSNIDFGAADVAEIGDSGTFTADTLTNGLADGASLSFSVTFDWAGTAAPGAQTFHVYQLDPTFQLLETLQSSPKSTNGTAPEPASLPLFAIGLLGWAGARSKNRREHRRHIT